MKQCIDCGTQFDDALSSCPKCGCPAENCSSVVSAAPQQQYVQQNPVGDQQPFYPQFEPKFFLGRLQTWCIVAGALALLGALVQFGIDHIKMQETTNFGFLFLLLTMGVLLIGIGCSIKTVPKEN